jgi:hypothetical protein
MKRFKKATLVAMLLSALVAGLSLLATASAVWGN